MSNFRKAFSLMSMPHFFPLVLIFVVTLLASRALLGPGYFVMHDDLQMMRQLEMEKCFLDLQIPCRWVPDMGYGFGYPLFNFYPPLPYLVGQVVRLVGFNFMDTIKILFSLSFLASGITMYWLAKEFFGRFGGTVAAVFYIWAPYHAVDIYVRGAMNESWAIIWFPLILFTSYKLITSKSSVLKWVVLLAVSWFCLFTSHNLMVLIFVPVFAIWMMLFLLKTRNYDKLLPLVLAGLWSVGLAAFFTIPVFLETHLVQTEALVQGYSQYTTHFVNVSQILFSRFWGYGPSLWIAEPDQMSFQIGWIHWIVSIVVGLLSLYRYHKTRKLEPWLIATLFLLFVGWFSAFMAHSRSVFIWQSIAPLEYVQFPWRFLTLVILAFSFVAGALTKFFGLFSKVLGLVLILGVIIYSWNYFLPPEGKLGPLTDEQKFSGLAWEIQQKAGIVDYLPRTAYTAPKEPMRNLVEFMNGSGEVLEKLQGTDWARFVVHASQDSQLRLGILEFPEWKITLNGTEVDEYVQPGEEWGRMYIDIPAGTHEIEVELQDTPPRTIGNVLSILSWGLLAGVVISKSSKRK